MISQIILIFKIIVIVKARIRRSGTTTCKCIGGIPEHNCVSSTEESCQIGSCQTGYYGLIFSNNKYLCAINECYCDHGRPKRKELCSEDGLHACDTCTSGYVLDDFNDEDRKLCIAMICPCYRGTGFSNGECLDDNINRCEKCDVGFQLNYQTESCLPIDCLCQNGTPENTEGTFICGISHLNPEICLECDEFYHKTFDSCQYCTKSYQVLCERNVCQCDLGLPAQNCSEHLSTQCDSCFADHHQLDLDQTSSTYLDCVNKICLCDNGIPVSGESCTAHNHNICQTCNQFYHLEPNNSSLSLGSVCRKNICFCHHGTVNSNCLINGTESCETCDQNYHLDQNQICVKNICQCDNGVPGEYCIVDQEINCISCHENYHLIDTAGFPKCVENVCHCENGNPAAKCPNNDMLLCETCEPFYHLENSMCVKNTCICSHGDLFETELCEEHSTV